MSGPLSGKRIGLLTAQASRLGGGVFEAVVLQAQLIRDLGGDAVVFALDDEHAHEDARRLAPIRVVTVPVTGLRQIGFAPNLVPALLKEDLDCLHLHGIWMYPSHAGRRWAQVAGRPYVVSPHGMLSPWIVARGRWKKALARIGYERASWRAAAVLHALTQAEAADIARETGGRQSVVIPNPAPPLGPPPAFPPRCDFVFISRIHPKKNLSALVTAWRAAQLPGDARLTIAGWGEPEECAALEAAIARCGDTVRFVGPVFGQAKDDLLRSARFVVLPSLSEGLPMAILEGWAAGKPSVMTAHCNLGEGFSAGAAIECGTDEASIADALRQAAAVAEADWHAMAAAAQGLAATQFSAAAVARQWSGVYGAAADHPAQGSR